MQHIRLKREPKLTPLHRAFVYQAEAFNAVKDLEYAAIFHEQGLGKTKIAIDLMLYWLEKQKVDTVLFVVKKGLVRNWLREFTAHTHIRPKVLTQNRAANFYVYNSPARAIVTHYEAVKAEKQRMQLFLKTRDVAAVLDESVKIKNPDATVTRAFFDLSPLFKRRVIMTGTPVANRPQDLWAQVWFLDQGESLGRSFDSFRKAVGLSNDLAHDAGGRRLLEQALQKTLERISAFAVRETKTTSGIALPEKVIESVRAHWEPFQLDLYRRVRDDLRAVVVKEGVPTEDAAESVLKRLLRLVQIASNPRLVDEAYAAAPGKLDPARDLVSGICSAGEKCIIWTSFTENVDWLAREFRPLGTTRVHGKLTMEQRGKALDLFVSDPNTRVLLATPGAAKEGLTLTVANHVIFYDRTFSLDDYLQAQDRIHRISQERRCYVHNIIMHDSIDEWVDVLLHSKHMAAQLAQGDISLEYYRRQMRYDFGEVLRQVLGITGSDEEPHEREQLG
jgi:SNF2 family DNA or RNA helicase